MNRQKEESEIDTGFFGPDSITWRINRETTVLFGGAKALLMHAAHPLIAAGARQTGGYKKDPWARLLSTLQLQNLVTFGTNKFRSAVSGGQNQPSASKGERD